jgi:hypothetical protein
LAYLQHFSRYRRAQVTRLVSRWVGSEALVKQYRAPPHAFARRYTAVDVALLAEVDRTLETLSGPATGCVLRPQRDVFGDTRFERLGSIPGGPPVTTRAAALRISHGACRSSSRSRSTEQFPFRILGFHADNGSEYVN